jgi:prepilin-type N-terminal cleavage/methylation domain-containing protein
MKQAFSLVELSIVLVILGLLTGGILTGQSLIRAAALRGTIADTQRYITAVYTFRDEYQGLPGDMRNATAYWGAADGGDGAGSDCFTAVVSDGTTCNGNHDGWINSPAGGSGVWLYGERFSAWKQLANAGLIEGSYTGRTDSTTGANVVAHGVNAPSAKVAPGVYTLAELAANSLAFFQPPDTEENVITLSGLALTGAEAWNLDKKLDDGLPGVGKITSIHFSHASGGNCADNANISAARYQVDNRTKGCSLAIRW